LLQRYHDERQPAVRKGLYRGQPPLQLKVSAQGNA
jgi:hypothetical protein